MPVQRASVEAQFYAKCDVQPDGCWLWTGPLSRQGYAAFSPSGGKTQRGHRWAYERFIGVIPDGHHVHHTCVVRRCVNPHHLEALSPLEHRRKHKHTRGRIRRSGRSHTVYLTHEQNTVVNDLRDEQGWPFSHVVQAALELYFAQRGIDWPATYPELVPVKQAS